jgi:hypothetical protein
MTLTVRHRGQLLSAEGQDVVDDVVAVIWFDPDEETGAWGGIVELGKSASDVRRQVSDGPRRYGLRLDDGRHGTIEMILSEFVADGAPPLAFSGIGTLARETTERGA